MAAPKTKNDTPAPLLETSSLVDIARHGDKVLKTARLSSELGYGLAQNKINMLDAHSSPIDVLLAFEEDLAATAKDVKQLGSVVDSLNGEHVAAELKGVDEDFKTLFGDDYDPDNFALTMYGVRIRKGTGIPTMDLEAVKSVVYAAAVGSDLAEKFPYKEYKSHLKNVRHAKRNKPSSDATLSDLIGYSYSRSSIPDWLPFTNQVKEMADRNADLRASLDIKSRKVLDRKVLGVSQAMVDGVAKSSTYITKKDGVDQISSRHKKHQSVLSKIEQLVYDTPCVRAVEIDESTDIEKFHDMMIDIKAMNLDVPDAFELKSRKLGNYRACGLMATRTDGGDFGVAAERGLASNKFKIVALDVNSPTSGAHEIAHFRDVNEQDPVRNNLVRHFGNKVDRENLNALLGGSEHYFSYYLSHREIVARLGEIGFLLNKHDYQENESLEAFYGRVTTAESLVDSEKVRFDVALAKPLEVYMGDNPLSKEIYFNMANWQPAELAMVKDFAHNMFFKPRPEMQARLLERIEAGELDGLSKTYHETRKNRKKRIAGPTSEKLDVQRQFGRLPARSLAKTYLAGVEEGLFKDGEFAEGLAMSIDRLGRGGATKTSSLGRVGREEIGDVFNGVAEWSKVIDPVSRPGDAMVAKMLITELACNFSVLPKDVIAALPSRMDKMRIAPLFDEMGSVIPLSMWDDAESLNSHLEIKTYGLNRHGLKYLEETGAADNLKTAYERLDNMGISTESHKLSVATDLVKTWAIKDLAFSVFGQFERRPSEDAHDFAWSMENIEIVESLASPPSKNHHDSPFSSRVLTDLLDISELWGKLIEHEYDLAERVVSDGGVDRLGLSTEKLNASVKSVANKYCNELADVPSMRFSSPPDDLMALLARSEQWLSGHSQRGGWLAGDKKIPDLLRPSNIDNNTTQGLERYALREQEHHRNGVGPSPLLSLFAVVNDALKGDDRRGEKLNELCLTLCKLISADPAIKAKVADKLDDGVKTFNRHVGKISVASEMTHPWVRNFTSVSVVDELANIDDPYSPSDAFLYASISALVATVRKAGTSDSPYSLIAGGILEPSVNAGEMTASEIKHFGLNAIHEQYAEAAASLPLRPVEEIHGYLNGQEDIARSREAIDEYIAQAAPIDEGITKQVLQAFAAVPTIHFPVDISKYDGWMKEQLCTYKDAAGWVNLALSEEKVRYQKLDEWVDKRLVDLRPETPKVSVQAAPSVANKVDTPSTKIDHLKAEPDVKPYNMVELNEDVPAAKAKEPLRPKHQMKMF